MSISIDLPPDDEKRLAERAASTGRTPAEYLRWLLHCDLGQAAQSETGSRSVIVINDDPDKLATELESWEAME